MSQSPRGYQRFVRAAQPLSVLLLLLAGPLAGQERPVVTDSLRPYLAVDEEVYALTGVRVVDGTAAAPREDQTVVVRGARIESVGPRATTPIPEGARVLDLPDRTVLPGLVQLHEHTYLGGAGPVVQMDGSAPLLLASGVTTAMTAGSQRPDSELRLKQAVDDGLLPGPRLHVAGPYISGTPALPTFARAGDAAEARALVAEWAGRGATWFKVHNGPAAILEAVIQAAHARGLRVSGHLCAVTFAEAAALGINALQHGFITDSEHVPGRVPGRCPPANQVAQADVDVASPAVQESIQRIAGAGTAVVSTLAVYETFVPGRARLDPRAMEMLAPAARAAVEGVHAGLDRARFTVPERLLRRMMEWERDFVAAGGLLASGSDPWGTGLLPGYGNLRNYELFVEAGFAPEEAVRIMTFNGARIMGMDDWTGTIEPGKVADLVVIRGDPVAEPEQIYQVELVVLAGLGYDAARLRESVRGRLAPGAGT